MRRTFAGFRRHACLRKQVSQLYFPPPPSSFLRKRVSLYRYPLEVGPKHCPEHLLVGSFDFYIFYFSIGRRWSHWTGNYVPSPKESGKPIWTRLSCLVEAYLFEGGVKIEHVSIPSARWWFCTAGSNSPKHQGAGEIKDAENVTRLMRKDANDLLWSEMATITTTRELRGFRMSPPFRLLSKVVRRSLEYRASLEYRVCEARA